MSSLPLRLPIEQMQVKWKSQLDPLLANPANSILILNNIALKIGINVINHKLQQQLQGWIIVDIDKAANIYRSAPSTDLTLTLTSDVAVNISLGVF